MLIEFVIPMAGGLQTSLSDSQYNNPKLHVLRAIVSYNDMFSKDPTLVSRCLFFLFLLLVKYTFNWNTKDKILMSATWPHKSSVHVCFSLTHVMTAKKCNEIKLEGFHKQDKVLTKGAPLATPALKKLHDLLRWQRRWLLSLYFKAMRKEGWTGRRIGTTLFK